MKNRVTTNQKHTTKPQAQREHKHNTKENHQATKGKTKKQTERNTEDIQHQLENKVSNGNKYIPINNYLLAFFFFGLVQVPGKQTLLQVNVYFVMLCWGGAQRCRSRGGEREAWEQGGHIWHIGGKFATIVSSSG